MKIQKIYWYVACSRAKKNLRVFYLDDVSSFRNGIESIFGEIEVLMKKGSELEQYVKYVYETLLSPKR